MVDNFALDIRKRSAEQKRAVVRKLVRIIFSGKQGLALRGYSHEAAYELTEDNVNFKTPKTWKVEWQLWTWVLGNLYQS